MVSMPPGGLATSLYRNLGHNSLPRTGDLEVNLPVSHGCEVTIAPTSQGPRSPKVMKSPRVIGTLAPRQCRELGTLRAIRPVPHGSKVASGSIELGPQVLDVARFQRDDGTRVPRERGVIDRGGYPGRTARCRTDRRPLTARASIAGPRSQGPQVSWPLSNWTTGSARSHGRSETLITWGWRCQGADCSLVPGDQHSKLHRHRLTQALGSPRNPGRSPTTPQVPRSPGNR